MATVSHNGDPIRAIRVKYAEEAGPFRDRVLRESREMLWEDFRNLSQTGDTATHRANAVGLALLDARLYHMAADLYEWLVKQVETYMKKSTDAAVADRAVLYRNWGIALTLQGDYDRGIPRFLIAKQLAEQSGTSYDQYMAETNLVVRFENPALWLLSSLADDVYRRAYLKRIDETPVRQALERLGDGRYVVYAAVMRMVDLWRSHRERPTIYTSLALLRELRILVGAVESLARLLRPDARDLGECCRSLFGRGRDRREWWTLVARERANTSYRDHPDFERKLGRLLRLDLKDDEGFFAKSLCVALLVRNFLSHELVPSPHLIGDQFFPPAKCHVVAALVALHLAVERAPVKQGVTK